MSKPVKMGGRSIKTRDWAMVRVIQGVTKGGIHKDEVKEASRYECRGKGSISQNREEWEAAEEAGEEEE